MNAKKVVLIAAPHDYIRWKFASLLAPSTSILAVGSYLTAHDIPVELIDLQIDFGFGMTRAAERIVSQRVAQYLREQADDIAWVGISQVSNTDSGFMLAEEIHTALTDTPLIFGGYFPSSAYRLLFERLPFISAVVRGDGEVAALEISRSLASGQSFLSDQIPNLVWLDEGEIRMTPFRPVDLDSLPILDFQLLRNPSWYQIIMIISSKGCPFHCSYCLESQMRPYAAFPAAWLDQQLSHLEAVTPNDWVHIFDPIFGLERESTLELCQVMREHRFTYAVESRGDILAPDLIPSLREAGVEVIYLGLESASAATLMRMNKVRSVAQAREYVRKTLELVKVCFENDVTPFIGTILPFLGDSEADFQESREFIKAIERIYEQVTAQTGVGPGFVPFTWPLSIYTGSPVEEQAKEFSEAILRSEPFVGERTLLSPSPKLDPGLIEQYQKEIDEGHRKRTPLLPDRSMPRCFHFLRKDLERFLTVHPELVDEEGVVTLGDSSRLLFSSLAF